jgi:hypothetical protein
MPTYCYELPHGGAVERVFMAGKAPRTIRVGRSVAKRSYTAERASVPSPRGWPLTCFASGVNAAQAGELRDHLAKVGVPTEVTRDGDPVYRDAAHRKKALKARGFIDRKSYC